jgi:hypothetical protein
VKDLYADQLQIASDPLTDQGLHLVALKSENRLIHLFNDSLISLEKKKKVEALQKKWQLAL